MISQHQIHMLLPMLCKYFYANVRISNYSSNYWELDQNLRSFIRSNLRTKPKYLVDSIIRDQFETNI
jgi:hypothetical protein